MAKRKSRPRGHRFTEKGYKAHATAIGQVVLAWNDLHDVLAGLFCQLVEGNWGIRTLGVWNSANFDRAKREMIRGFVKASRAADGYSAPMKDDILWLLERTDSVEQVRNDIIHSPLWLVGSGTLAEYAGMVGRVIPGQESHAASRKGFAR